MTPDQYRREGAEAMRKAALYQCVRVPAELPGSPRMAFELGLYSCESAIRAIDVDDVLAGMPAAPDAVAQLVEAARAALNYLENTEGEFGITLESATNIRAALAAMETSHAS